MTLLAPVVRAKELFHSQITAHHVEFDLPSIDEDHSLSIELCGQF